MALGLPPLSWGMEAKQGPTGPLTSAPADLPAPLRGHRPPRIACSPPAPSQPAAQARQHLLQEVFLILAQLLPMAAPNLALLRGYLLPSKAGARGEASGPGARRLTVRSLSVPPRAFSMQVYTVAPGAGERPGLRWPRSTGATRHRATHGSLENRVAGRPERPSAR